MALLIQTLCTTRQISPGIYAKLEPFSHFPDEWKLEIQKLLVENGRKIDADIFNSVEPDAVINIIRSENKLYFEREWSIGYTMTELSDAIHNIFEWFVARKTKLREIIFPEIVEIVQIPPLWYPPRDVYDLKIKFDPHQDDEVLYCLPEEVEKIQEALIQAVKERFEKARKIKVSKTARKVMHITS